MKDNLYTRKEQARSADTMVNLFRNNKNLLEKLKRDPLPVLEEIRDKAKEENRGFESIKSVYIIAIIVLGLIVLITALGSIYLVMYGKALPEVLVSLGSASAGALVGIFVKSPSEARGY